MIEQNGFQTEITNEDEISFAEIFFRYLRYWKVFLISIVLCVGLAFLYLHYAVPQYQVVSKIEISDEKKGQSVVDMTAFSDLGIITPKNNLDNEIEILNSRTLIRSVVDSLKIDVSYYASSKFKRTELYKRSPIFVSISYIEKGGSFTVDLVSENSLSIHSEVENYDRVVKLGQEIDSPWGTMVFNLNPFGTASYPVEVIVSDSKNLPNVNVATINKASSVVEISLVTSCPEKGEDIINTLIDQYNRNAINEKNYVARNTVSFINERLSVILDELKIAEKDVENFRQREGITDLEAQGQLWLSSSSEYDKKITETGIQLEILRSIKSFLTSPTNSGNIVPSNVGLTDQTIISLIHTYNEEIMAKNKATAGVKPGSPLLTDAENHIASLKDNLLKGISIAESTLELTIRELRRQDNMYLGKARGLSTQERESRELYRQQSIKESLLIYLLQKKEETGLSLILATPNAKVVDRAYYSSTPVAPKKSFILLAALILALGIPVCIIYIISLFANKIYSKEEISRIVKAPFLGELPFVKTTDPFPVLKVRSVIAERARVITSNLGFIVGNAKTKIISVTSSTGNEGKSFFSLNLAMSLATTGKKTLLIDLDMRKSTMDRILNLAVDKGSVIFLSEAETLIDEVIDKSHTYHKNLDIIPVKVFPPNPAELLASDRLEQLFRSVEEKDYEYVFVDMAPIGLVADAFRINQFSMATIFMVRAEYTYKRNLQDIQELYRENKLKNMCVVLNAVSTSNHYGYAYGHYGHDAQKSGYYTEES
jgi:capsular exopolysaccharide synthesis family protein